MRSPTFCKPPQRGAAALRKVTKQHGVGHNPDLRVLEMCCIMQGRNSACAPTSSSALYVGDGLEGGR